MEWQCVGQYLFLSLVIMNLFKQGVYALDCYSCKALTDIDDSNCLDPYPEGTLTQTCQGKDEVCEKKLIRIDAWTEKTVRGCSSNCAGRPYIWTEDFRVHCCGDNNLCNAATRGTVSVALGLVSTLMVFILNTLRL